MSEKDSKKRRRNSTSKSSKSSSKNKVSSVVDSQQASQKQLAESVRISQVHNEDNSGSKKLAVASFGAVLVPDTTEFQVFEKKSHGHERKEMLVHGENTGIEYEGKTEQGQSQYIVALYDEDNGSIELYPGTNYVEMSSAVTANKYSKLPRIKSKNVLRVHQRNKLGETFGTRKAKKAITDLEVNKIDATMLDDIQTDLVDSVASTTANLPTQDEVQASMAQDRPIPPHNLEAQQREDIYPLFGVVPKREWNLIRVEAILREQDEEARRAMVPSGSSEFVSARLAGLTDASKHTERLQLLYYVAVLMTAFNARKTCHNKAALTKSLLNPPDMIVNGIIDRFVASKGGSNFGRSKDRAFVIDTTHESKLLCYLLALILRLDNYILEILPLATQLGLKPSRLTEVLRQLGCNIKNATALQAEALGLSRQVAASYKIATLSAPLKLPDVVRRKRRAA